MFNHLPRRISLLLILLITLSGCTTFQVSESNMFPSFGLGQTLPEGTVLEEQRFTRDDGSSVYGLSVVADPDQPTVLYYGGNMQSVDGSMSGVVGTFTALDLNVYFFDRRGQGRNPGTGGVDTAFTDAAAVYEYVREQVAGPLILHGLSLGAFEAAAVAAEKPIDALVLEATATNVDDFVDHMLPWYAKPFIRVEVDEALRGFDNRDHLAVYEGPLFLIGGEDDRQTAPALMEKLYEASASTIRHLTIVEDAHHNNVMRKPQAHEAYRAFLSEAGLSGEE